MRKIILVLALSICGMASAHAQTSGLNAPPPPVCSASNAGALYTQTSTSPNTVWTCSYYNLQYQWVVNPMYGGLVYYPIVPTTCSGALPVFLAGYPTTTMYVCIQGVPTAVAGGGANITSLTGDATATGPGAAATTVTGINGAAIGASINVLSTNASKQVIAATYQNVVNLFGSGSCSGYLKSDGTCSTPSSIPTGTTNQLLYYAANGTTLTPLNLGTNLSITSGTLNVSGVVPTGGATLTGTLNQNFVNYLNPQFAQNNPTANMGNAINYFWSGTTPGTAAYNYGQYEAPVAAITSNIDRPGCAGFELNCYNTETNPFSVTENLNAQGGVNATGVNLNHWGIGDTIGTYYYINSFGGQADGGGPEGMEMISGQIVEPSNTWTGTVATAGQGQTTLSINCTNDCGQSPYGFATDPLHSGSPASVGQGLYVLDEQSPTAAGQIESVGNGSGETPGTLTVNITSGASNLAVSTCYGTLASTVSPTPDPAGSGTESMTFTLTLASGSGDCVAGEIASFSGFMHDQALITAVGTVSSGTQSITASVRQYHESGSYMFENPNSDAGLYADVVANNVSGVQFPFDILGVQSISGSTAVLWYRWFYGGSTPGQDRLPTGNMTLSSVSATSISNTGGTVTLAGGSINANSPWLNHQNLYISNASNSAFNGECTNATVNFTTNVITCTQSSSAGDTATSATITLTDASGTDPYGNSDVNFYQGAMVVNPQDTATSAEITVNGQTVYPVDGKQFTVEANEMPLASGDSMVEGHGVATETEALNIRNTTLNPGAYVSGGLGITLDGTQASGGEGAGGNNAGIKLSNLSPASQYTYFGGTAPAPPPIYVQGQWHGLAYFVNPPDPFSYLLDSPDCPSSPSSCTDPGYWYGVYKLAGNGGYVDSEYYPSTNTLQLNGNRQFNLWGNAYAFSMKGMGVTNTSIGFGGRTNASGQYAPLWSDTSETVGDLPEIAQCDVSGNTQCGLKDSGVAVSSLVPPAPTTLALGTSAITANSCASAQTVTVTGATTSMVAVFSGDGVLASSVTGYSSLKIDAAVTAANTVSVQVCNPTAASITPGALTLNVGAVQ